MVIVLLIPVISDTKIWGDAVTMRDLGEAEI